MKASNPTQTKPITYKLPTYKLTLYFDGRNGRTKKIHYNLPYEKAADWKDGLLRNVPACVEAYMEPEK